MALLPQRTTANTAAEHVADHNQIHLKLNDVPNVRRDYGAAGNGTTNDVAAFQAAYDALPSTAGVNNVIGGVIFIPPGRYNIGTPGIDMTAGKPCFWLGANHASSSISANQVATQLRTASGATWPIMTIGPAISSSQWFGSRIENVAFVDAGTTFNTTGAVLQQHGNFTQFVNCDFGNFQAGYGVRQAASSYDPQFTLFQNCRFQFNKYGIRQYYDGLGGVDDRASDTEIYNCFFSSGAYGAGTVIAGSVGLTLRNSTRIFGGTVQNFETAVSILGDGNRFMGTAFENTMTGGTLGIDITGNMNQIIGADIVGTYSTAGIRLNSGAARNVIIAADDNSANVGFIVDNSGNTRNLIIAANYGLRTRQEAKASLPSAASVGAGAMIYDSTNSKPMWSDGTTWRYADGTT